MQLEEKDDKGAKYNKIAFAEYLEERKRIWEQTMKITGKAIDADTEEIIDLTLNDWEKASEIISILDEDYRGIFEGCYFLWKKHEMDKWSVFKLNKIYYHDSHNIQLVSIRVGKNFKEYNNKDLFARKGYYKSTNESEICSMFGWHRPKVFSYSKKHLYIFKSELGRIKIGQAINVEQRMESISSQAGIRIEILNSIYGAAKYENVLHKIFYKERFIGEWFILSDIQIKWLCELNHININTLVEHYKTTNIHDL